MLQAVPASRGCCSLGQVAPGGPLSLPGAFMRLNEAKFGLEGHKLHAHSPSWCFWGQGRMNQRRNIWGVSAERGSLVLLPL